MKLARMRTLELLPVILLIGFLVGFYGIALQAPGMRLFHDDGIYLVTAKALAEGNGYRIESLPGEPPQTKYPVLFPFFVALVWKVFPSFPDNAVLLKSVPLLFSVLWTILLFLYFKQESSSARTALWIVLLTAASPWVLFFSTILMAETLFACLCTAALLGFQRWERTEGTVDLKTVLVCALMAAAAFLARTVGVAIIAAGIGGLLMRRKFAAALLFSLACLLVVSPWLGWQAAHPESSAESFAYYSSSNYQQWNVILGFTVSQKIAIVLQNLIYLIASPTVLLGFWLTPTSVFFMLAIDGLILIGFLVDVWDRIRPIHIFLVIYFGIILLWAWPPVRFLIPVLPFLLFFGYRGLVIAFRRIAARRTMSRTVTGVVVVSLLANLSYSMVLAAKNTLAKGSESFHISEADQWEDLSSLQHWIRTHTPPEAILQSNLDPVFYLYTGRKTIRGFLADPFELFYVSDPHRPLGQPLGFGQRLVQHQVDYVVRTPSRAYKEGRFLNELIDGLVSEYPEAFTLVYAGPNPDYRIYRVDNMALRRSLSMATQ